MPSLETTNWILAIIAAASAAQFLMLFIGAFWVARRVAQVQESVTTTLARFEAEHVPQLSAKVSDLVDDLHKVAIRVDRVGAEVERATRIAQGALHLAGSEVERATRGVRLAFDVVEGGVRQAAVWAPGSGPVCRSCSRAGSTGGIGSRTKTPSRASKPAPSC